MKYDKIKQWMGNQVPTVLIGLDLFLIVMMYTIIVAYIPTMNGDNIEHVHSSYLVAMGQVPYRDFFQHHNPLMWYVFAPIVKMFAFDATITEVTCFISYLVFLKSLIYVYHICREFLCDKKWSMVAVALVALPGYKLFSLDFRPDNFMVFCLVGGIYYYFRYLQDKKSLHLTIAFLWFMVSFLFAQKALFPLFMLGLSGLYFWAKKEIMTKDMVKALILPGILGLGFWVYLYHYDMVLLYFNSNYHFNLILADSFDAGRIAPYAPYMVILVYLAFFGSVCAVFSKNKYWKLLAFLFVAEFIQRRFYFSPYSYYYWFMMYLASFCGVAALYGLNEKFKGLIWGAVVGLFIIFADVAQYQYMYFKTMKDKPYLPDYISRNINPCDYVFNGDGMMYNLFGKDPAYYWQLIGQLDVIGEKAGIQKKPDMNALILKYKPKFIFGKNYMNKFANETRGIEIVHYIDQEIVEKYYEQTTFPSVFKLKKEYDNRVCEFDYESSQWTYKN